MGQTVVFTVSPDADDVDIAIASTESRPPHHPVRDAALSAVRDRRWRLAFVVAFAFPALVAAITLALTDGQWVTTAYLAAAALVTPASGAFAGARRCAGLVDERVAHWAVAAGAGAMLALAQVPGVTLAARAEAWGEAGVAPTLTALAVSGAFGAMVGIVIAARVARHAAVAAGAVMLALALVPLAIYALMLPTTQVTETITDLTFTTTYDLGRPAYVCGTQDVKVTRKHTELIAWMAFASPIAWVVDAAAFTPAELAAAPDGSFAQSQAWTRSTRVGPDAFMGHCYAPTSLGVPASVREARYAAAPSVGVNAASTALIVALGLALVTSLRRR